MNATKSYWVFAEEEPKGPYRLESVVELIRRRAVSEQTPLRVDGTAEWVRADSLPEVRAHLGAGSESAPKTLVTGAAASTQPMPRPPSEDARAGGERASPRPRRVAAGLTARLRSAWLRLRLGLAIGLGGGGALVAALLLVPRLLDARPLVPDTVVEEGLPANIQSVVVVRVGGGDFSQEQQGLRVSALAGLCGGDDVGAELLRARGRSPRELQTAGTLTVLQREGLREEMQCAQRMARSAGGLHLVQLQFEDGDRSRAVALAPLGDLSSPPFPRRHNFSGLHGRCHPSDDEDVAGCADSEQALVRRGRWWAFGDVASVGAYAREWNRGAERSETTNMEYARVLAQALDEDALVTRVIVRPEALPFADLCGAVPGGAAECLPDHIEDTRTRIRTQVRGVSVQVTRPSAGAFRPDLRWVMAFAARDDEDAEDVARELEVLLQDWRAHLDNNESVFVERLRDSERRDVDQAEAELRAFVRAVRDAEIDRDGRLARLVARAELSEAEQREVRAHLGTVRGDREAASRVVLAIIAGEPPAEGDLSRLVGAEAATWMLRPRASRQTCDAIRARLAEFGARASALEFGSAYRLAQRFEEGRCAGRVMSDRTRRCLTEAPSLTAMEACPVERPPWQRPAGEEASDSEPAAGSPR